MQKTIKAISLSTYALEMYQFYLKSFKNPLDFARFILIFKENEIYKKFDFTIEHFIGNEMEIRTHYAESLAKFLKNPDHYINTKNLQENPKLIALLISYPAYRNPNLAKKDGEFVRFSKPNSDYKECIFIEGYLNDNIENYFFTYLRINQNKVQKDKLFKYYENVIGDKNNLAQTIMNRLGL